MRWVGDERIRWSHGSQETIWSVECASRAGGLFIATRQPFRAGAPIEIEIEEPRRTLRISAVVKHAASFPPLYQQVFRSGMGVRFRRPEEPATRSFAQLGVPLADRGGRRKYPRTS